MNTRFQKPIAFCVFFLFLTRLAVGQPTMPASHAALQWGQTCTVRDYETGSDSAISSTSSPATPDLNAANESADSGYGSQYCRLLSLAHNKWLAVYTVHTNKGYQKDPQGGLRLEIAASGDNGSSWKVIARLKDPGRDLDNGQLILLNKGHILLACRSVRWQSSYRLPVYESVDEGRSWRYLSLIDGNEGPDGSLGKPDKGTYEPHFIRLKNDQLAVFYANEKHVTESPSYSQVISEKISTDEGKTWGQEIFVAHDTQNKDARPGMPVCTRMGNNTFMVVYEVCGTKGCNIYQKSSKDGVDWQTGIGTAVPDQTGAPFILSMSDGTLVVTSNRGNISLSRNYGQSWNKAARPWLFSTTYEKDWQQALWPSLYQFGPDKVGVTAALKRPGGKSGREVKIRFGQLN